MKKLFQRKKKDASPAKHTDSQKPKQDGKESAEEEEKRKVMEQLKALGYI